MATDPDPITCGVCGVASTGPLETLSWTFESARGRDTRVCTACSREHVRAIEAKLDQEWW